MEFIGSYEAKTRLPEYLDRAAGGEEFVITKHGKPVARLSPPSKVKDKQAVQQAIEGLKAFRKRNTLGEGLTVRDLIEDGRRF